MRAVIATVGVLTDDLGGKASGALSARGGTTKGPKRSLPTRGCRSGSGQHGEGGRQHLGQRLRGQCAQGQVIAGLLGILFEGCVTF